MVVTDVSAFFGVVCIAFLVAFASVSDIRISDIVVGIVEVLPGVTCHYVYVALDGFYIFGIVKIEVEQVITTEVVPYITISQTRKVGVLYTLHRTGSHKVTSCSFGYVVT